MPSIPTKGDDAFTAREKQTLERVLEQEEFRLANVEAILAELAQLAAGWKKGWPAHHERDQLQARALFNVFGIVIADENTQRLIAEVTAQYRAAGRVLASAETRFLRYYAENDNVVAEYTPSVDPFGQAITGEVIWVNAANFFPDLHNRPTDWGDDYWQSRFRALDLDMWRYGILVHEAIHYSGKHVGVPGGDRGHQCALGPLANPFGYQKFLYATSSVGLELAAYGLMPALAPPQCKAEHASRTLQRVEHFGPSRLPGPTRYA